MTYEDLVKNFPHETIRPVQEEALRCLAIVDGKVTLEIPTGEGKTAVGAAALLTLSKRGVGPLFYVTPTKTLVSQAAAMLGENVVPMFGRSEYPCLYYEEQEVNAAESPCYMLACKHRVDQETGETVEVGAAPCPYLQAKYEARQRLSEGAIVVCSMAFFLMNRLLVNGWRELDPALVVVDEAHVLAEVARSVFEQQVTDTHLYRCAALVQQYDSVQAERIRDFCRAMMGASRPSGGNSLLTDEDLAQLISVLAEVDTSAIARAVRQAMDDGVINPVSQQKELKALERITHGIPRLLSSLGYAMATDKRAPLSFVIAYRDEEEVAEEGQRAKHRLTLKPYFVKNMLGRALGTNVVAMSATIGNPRIFDVETGLDGAFYTFASSFSSEQTRIILPRDTPNLSHQKQGREDPKKAVKMMLEAARTFAARGHRSLIVVTSEEERQRVIRFAERDGPTSVTYGNGRTSRQAAAAFIGGEGQILIGTAAQYAMGLDLPAGIAPVIFFLRPGFASPSDPRSQFERKRFSDGHCWALWQWRVLIEALQVRGRNVRSLSDIGICFFISQQFRNFLYAGLPEWLKSSYRSNLTMHAGVLEGLRLLGSETSVVRVIEEVDQTV